MKNFLLCPEELHEKLNVHLIFIFCADMQDSVEEVLVLLHKLLGELQFSFILNYIVSSAKRIGVDLFEIAAPVDEKHSKHLQKIGEQKQFENNLEVEKKNPSVELEVPILEKIVQKSSRSRKNNFDKIK